MIKFFDIKNIYPGILMLLIGGLSYVLIYLSYQLGLIFAIIMTIILILKLGKSRRRLEDNDN